MSSFILRNRISKIDDIKAFDIDGYSFNKDLSADRNLSGAREWIFTRETSTSE